MKKTKFDFVTEFVITRLIIFPTIVIASGEDFNYKGFSVEAHWLFWGLGLFVDFDPK